MQRMERSTSRAIECGPIRLHGEPENAALTRSRDEPHSAWVIQCAEFAQ